MNQIFAHRVFWFSLSTKMLKSINWSLYIKSLCEQCCFLAKNKLLSYCRGSHMWGSSRSPTDICQYLMPGSVHLPIFESLWVMIKPAWDCSVCSCESKRWWVAMLVADIHRGGILKPHLRCLVQNKKGQNPQILNFSEKGRKKIFVLFWGFRIEVWAGRSPNKSF